MVRNILVSVSVRSLKHGKYFFAAFYIIFLGYKRTRSAEVKANSIMSNIAESYIRMFIMSLTEFATFFEQLEDCELTVLGKVRLAVLHFIHSVYRLNLLLIFNQRNMNGLTYILLVKIETGPGKLLSAIEFWQRFRFAVLSNIYACFC